jgi:23S rRNA pseudouridine2605 synthase
MNIYYLLNKPKGYITTTSDEFGRRAVMDLVQVDEKVFPVGRLDENTSGLLILTDDGQFSNLLNHPSHHLPKTYQLIIRGFLPKPVIKKFEEGILLNDGMTASAVVKLISRKGGKEIFELTIFEGKNRIIRRMCGKLGLELLELKRVAIGSLRDEKLGLGKFRKLTDEEAENLKSSAGHNK